jgi:hypothetical protein
MAAIIARWALLPLIATQLKQRSPSRLDEPSGEPRGESLARADKPRRRAMPAVIDNDGSHWALRVLLGDLHGTDERKNIRGPNETPYVLAMFRRLIFVDPIRICGQGSAVPEIQVVDLLRPEVDRKDAARRGNAERFGKKESRNQLRDVTEHYVHA